MDREGGTHTDGITTIYWLIQPNASFLRLACGDWKNWKTIKLTVLEGNHVNMLNWSAEACAPQRYAWLKYTYSCLTEQIKENSPQNVQVKVHIL
jgi:hypothetical protein